MKKLFLISALLVSSLFNTLFAQNLAQNSATLAQKLNILTKNEEDDAEHSFSFKGCQMNMDVRNTDSDVKFGMKLSWQMKDVRKVSYKKNKDGFYDFTLDVPADRIKMKIGFGNDNQIGGSFNLNDDNKDKDNQTNFDVHTKDERVVKDLAARFDEVVRTCKNMK